jgi:hypothetical protein
MGTTAGTAAKSQTREEKPVQADPVKSREPGPAQDPARSEQMVPGTVAGQVPPARVALVGVHGFGTHHLRNLARLQAAGVVELVAVADPLTLSGDRFGGTIAAGGVAVIAED